MIGAAPAGPERVVVGPSPARIAADLLLPVLVFAAVALAQHTAQYRRVVGEDGALEWLQVIAFAVTAGLLADLARRTRGAIRAMAIGAALPIVVVIGEELSWGTRLFGSGLEVIERYKRQGDTTLHNLGGGLEVSFLGTPWLPLRSRAWSCLGDRRFSRCR